MTFSLRFLLNTPRPVTILKGDSQPQGKEPVIGLQISEKGKVRWDF